MTPFKVIPIANVNIRTGVGTGFDINEQAPMGYALTVTDQKKDGDGTIWYKVENGWVSSLYVRQENQLETPPVSTFAARSAQPTTEFVNTKAALAASPAITNVISGIGSALNVNSGVLGALTGISSEGSQDAVLKRRIYGTPFQFLDSTDMRPTDGCFGLEFMNNIMTETPILSILPGVPSYLTDVNKDEREALTSKLVDTINEAASALPQLAKEALLKDKLDTKFFSFDSRCSEYMLYVNLMCRMCAIYLGIGDDNVPGTTTKYSEYNWFNWTLSNAYKGSANEFGGLTDLGSMLKDAFKAATGSGGGDSAPTEKDLLKYAKQEALGENPSVAYGKILNSMNGISNGASGNMYFIDTYYFDFFIKPPQFSESFSNDLKDSMFAPVLSAGSDLMKEFSFLFGGIQGDTSWIENNTEAFNKYSRDWVEKNINDESYKKVFQRLIQGSAPVISGANLIFPQIWSSSRYSPEFNAEIILSTPYGNRESIFLEIFVPMMHLLALTLPRQASVNSYTSPFLVRATCPGFFTCDMGIISDMQITRGGQNGEAWSVEGLPTEVQISLRIQPLYSSLSMSNFKSPSAIYNFIYNTAFIDYIGTHCGLNMKSTEWAKKLKLIKSLTSNILDDQWDYTWNTAREMAAYSKSTLLAGKG